jgi:hypothetical protein
MVRILIATAAIAVWTSPLTASGAAQSPLFWLYPDIVSSGDEVAAYGRSFCGDPACSPVTITIESRVAATGVAVASDGSFSVAVRVTEPVGGPYRVLASQKLGDGSPLEVEAGVRVAASDSGGGTSGTTSTLSDDTTTRPTSTPSTSSSGTTSVPTTSGNSGTAAPAAAAGEQPRSSRSLWPFVVVAFGAAGAVTLAFLVRHSTGTR